MPPYAVGGCIRDSLLGLPVHDWDLTTSATPDEMMTCFAGERLLPTGIRHGTMTLLRNGIPYEITTFRRDSGYRDHRRPERVDFVRDLREDLLRRDFTVNAMACDSGGRLSDPFGGQNDLRLHILRCVGEAEARLKEDALRILRALRFAACYDLTPEPQTEKALFALCDTLVAVSRERVLQELRRMLCGKSAGKITARFFPVLCAAVPGLTHEPPPLPEDFPKRRTGSLCLVLFRASGIGSRQLSACAAGGKSFAPRSQRDSFTAASGARYLVARIAPPVGRIR